ncbi:hypothetical protein AMJ51_00580 [Microgenomates bacterium DG_75]|nr:MAG: hypothetical protein AMJ51_00580 [Microgenomates bacterium DG_75]
MKKILPLIIIGVVVAIGLVIGGWLFLSKSKQISVPSLPGEVGQQVPTEQAPEEQVPAEPEEGFVGKLKDALTLGQSMKCTWEQDEDNFATSYIKDSKIRTEVTQAGEKAYSIMVEDCVYSWREGEEQGIKICQEPEEVEEAEEVTPEEFTAETPDVEYNCVPMIVPDSMFNPPTDVNFLSMEEMMGDLGE